MNLPQLGQQFQNTDRDYQITLTDSAGNVVTTFLGTETFACYGWYGDTLAGLFNLTATWINAAQGTIKITVDKTTIANLAPGWYRIKLSINGAGGRIYDGFDGVWQLLPGTGTGSSAIGPTYCSYDDMVFYAPWIEQLEDLTIDETGLGRERVRARSWFDDLIIARWKPTTAMPQLGQPGWGAWLMGGAGMNDPIPSKWLRDQLALNTLIVRDREKEITAKKAIAYVCDSQLGRGEKSPYQSLSKRFHRGADNLVKVHRAEIDINFDGYADIVVGLGFTNLR